MNNDLLISIRRTIVPVVVGVIVGSFLGPYVDPVQLERVITGVVTVGYYIVVRLIERHLPSFGLFLGARKQPMYLDTQPD